MFDFSRPPRNMEDVRKQTEVADMMFDVITDMLLSDPNCPEARKIEVQILSETKKLKIKFETAFLAFAEPAKDAATCEALLPLRREVLEYIRLMSVGVDSFLATHPAPFENKEI